MILTVRRSSGFPILLEDSEILTLAMLEDTEDYLQLEDYERQLRQSDSLKDIKIKVKTLDEINMFIKSLNHRGSITIDFDRSLVVINDNGDMIVC